MKPKPSWIALLISASFGLAMMATSVKADPPKVLELRVQKVKGNTYFHLRLQAPKDMAQNAAPRGRLLPTDFGSVEPLFQPRLVPQDENTRAVYLRAVQPEDFGKGPVIAPVPKKVDEKRIEEKQEEKKEPKPRPGDKDGPGSDKEEKVPGPPPEPPGPPIQRKRDRSAADVLEFVGKVTGKNEATFLLIYRRESKPAEKGKPESLQQFLQRTQSWAEVPIQLDLTKAKNIPVPAKGKRLRSPERWPDQRDLEGLWAVSQVRFLGQLASETPEFGFYHFARECTSQLYQVPPLGGPRVIMAEPFRVSHHSHFNITTLLQAPEIENLQASTRQLYEVTTGAAAITESLALNRLRNRNAGGKKDKVEERSVPIDKVEGITIAEHPWEKMMAGKKPAAEPLAKLVPHDNYYIHFKNIAKFIETSDLLDQWGTTLIRAIEVNSKDYRLKERYEQQLCLKSTGLARILGPAVIKSLAVTGNDPYVREGTDITVLFHLASQTLFKAGVEPFVHQARKKFGKQFTEGKTAYREVTIESFVSPLREVSLHRAFLGDYAIYSNSPIGIRRVIDCAKGKLKPLADSLDFKYMRTVFPLDDTAEDGFVFLSDPFIRNLVGPALRIKERRRLEALTSLHMVTQGALFTAWQTGKLPLAHQHLLETTGLKQEELFTPDGNGAFWDPQKKIAVSTNFNTLHFATPLIEVPIDLVTPREEQEYNAFRLEYLGLWRNYFDPIGMRLSLRGDQVRWETYILPLVRNSRYNELRQWAGGGAIKFDPAVFGDKTFVQFLMNMGPIVREFGGFSDGPGWDAILMNAALKSWIGDWFTIRLDDSPLYGQLLESLIRQQLVPGEDKDSVEYVEKVYQIPLTIGVDIRNPVTFAGLLTAGRAAIQATLPDTLEWRPMDPYKGVKIVRIKARPGKSFNLLAGLEARPEREPSLELYYALIDRAFYLSLREEPIKELIDRSLANQDKKNKKPSEHVETNSTLYFSPKAAVKAKNLLHLYLAWETHSRVQMNNRMLYALYRSGVVTAADASDTVEAAAMQYLGYVPVSPDLAPYAYDHKKDEVFNLRHGSLRRSKWHDTIEPTSPLGQLLAEFRSIRADLRFREDGIHTTLLFLKEKKSK
jgi:hypothetical protein